MSADHIALAERLVADTQARDGLAPVDLERFWRDQDVAAKDPFSPTLPQIPLNVFYSVEPVFDELGIPEDFWRLYQDHAWRLGLIKAYNDKAERIVGRRIVPEKPPAPPEHVYPEPKGLNDIFEAKNVWHGWSWWLQQSANTEDELSALLDRVERRLEKLREFLLPPDWDAHKARLMPLGVRPPLYRHQRGPCTFATSIFGSESLLLLILDNPDLAARFRDLILRAMLSRARILDAEAGYNAPTATENAAPRGFSFADDNCALLNPDMYEFFGLPILREVFNTYAPAPGDWRYQHSDSAMGHLLPLLGPLSFSAVNFGPTLTVTEIRRHCPRSVVQGQLAPFTLSRNEQVNIVREFLRDAEQSRPARGLLFSTAGSINNGTRLTSIRLLMAAAQRLGA